jgi:uncharacterized protein (DUF2384 family)
MVVHAPVLMKPGPGLRAFENIANAWKLSSQQRWILLGIPESTYYRYKREPDTARPSRDTFERISHVLGIYKALHVLFPSGEYADRWIHDGNGAFNGRSALDRMMGENVTDLADVRRYLDAERGW